MVKELLAWLVEPANYAQSLIKVEGRPLTLDLWQIKYLRDENKFINILKARRVGGSWVMTLKMFIRSQLSASYNGTFISMNQEEANGKIEYADQMYDSLPLRFKKKRVVRSKTEIAFEDSKGRRSILKSLASRAPRGKGGDVGISELPHCRDSEKIYEGALHVTSRSPDHTLTIESTPFGKRGIFYDLCRGRFSHFSLYRVPWWHSSALCADIERATREAPMLSTQKRVESFGTPSMRGIYTSMREDAFRQESELEFIEADDSAFSAELLTKNCVANFGSLPESDLRFISLTGMPSESDWHWLAKNIEGSLVAGYDVGRKKDESVLFVLDDFRGRLEARMMIRLPDTEFSSQEDILSKAIRAGVSRLAIDSTGIGLPIAEKMAKSFGDAVLPVHFTAGIKNRMVAKTNLLLMDGKLALPLERNIVKQMQSIERKLTDSGNVIYSVSGSGEHHADIAWAIMLACHAEGRSAAQLIHYEPVLTRKERQLAGRW